MSGVVRRPSLRKKGPELRETVRGRNAAVEWPRTGELWNQFRKAPGEAAFQAFYQQTRNFVFSIAWRVLGDEEETQDVLQFVYTHLYELALADECPIGIDEYIYRTTVREADRIRSRRRRRRAADAGPDAVQVLPDRRPAADDQLHDRRMQQTVEAALQSLPDDLRQPVELHYVRGMTHEEVAAELGVSRNRASYLIYKGLEKLEVRLRRLGITESTIAVLAALGLARLPMAPAAEFGPVSSSDPLQSVRPGPPSAAPAPSPAPRFVSRTLLTRPALPWLGGAAALAVAALLFLTPWAGYQPPNSPQAGGGIPSVRPTPPAAVPASTTTLSPSSASDPARNTPYNPSRAGLHGRTVAARGGEPISGVRVSIEQEGAPPREIVSGTDGTFSLTGLRPGDCLLRFEPPPPFGRLEHSRSLIEGRPADLGNIGFRRLGRIRGRVIHEIHGAVAGREVVLSTAFEDTTQSRVTDGNGRFEFADLPFRNYGIQALGSRYYPYRMIELPDGGDRDVDLLLGDGTLTVTVTRQGRPEPRVEVRLFREYEADHFTLVRGTGPAGMCAIGDLASGRYRLEAKQKGRNEKQKVVAYVDIVGSKAQHVEVTLPSGTLTGEIRHGDGTPAANARLRIVPEDLTGSDESFPKFDVETSSTAAGTFMAEGLPPGRYLLTAVGGDGGGAATAVSAVVPFEGTSEDVVMTLNRGQGAVIRARARDSRSGDALPYAWCDLITSAGRLRWPREMDADGRIVIRDIPPGTYQVEISAFGWSHDRKLLQLQEGDELNLEAALLASGAIEWAVVSPDGRAAAGLECMMEPLDAQDKVIDDVSRIRLGRTDAEGMWVVRSLAPGRYRLTAHNTSIAVKREVDIYAQDRAQRRVLMDPTEIR